MSDSCTASWEGAEAYTSPASDAVTAAWPRQLPDPTDALVLSLQFNSGIEHNILVTGLSTLPLFLQLGEQITRFRLSPHEMWPGYSSDGTNITIPISALTGLSAEEADATIGNWLDILQAILRREEIYIGEITLLKRPKAVGIFRLADYNYTHITLGRCLKRTFLQHFNILFGEPKIHNEP